MEGSGPTLYLTGHEDVGRNMGVGAVDVAGTVRLNGRVRQSNEANVTGSDRQAAGHVVLGQVRPGSGPVARVTAQEIDGATVRAAASGDHRAFARIVAHYEPRVRALAFHLLGDAERTHDAVQETFLDAYRGLSTFRGQAAFGTWLHRVAYNAALRQLRRPGPAEAPVAFEEGEDDVAGDEPDEELALRDAVRAALAELPPEQRLTVLLIDRDGYDYREVARIMDCPAGTVCSRLHRAHAALRAGLAAAGAVGSHEAKEA